MIRDSLILAKRTITKMFRNPEQFIDVTVQPIIMTVIFVFIFGGAIAGSTGKYVEFALPGIIVQSAYSRGFEQQADDDGAATLRAIACCSSWIANWRRDVRRISFTP